MSLTQTMQEQDDHEGYSELHALRCEEVPLEELHYDKNGERKEQGVDGVDDPSIRSGEDGSFVVVVHR